MRYVLFTLPYIRHEKLNTKTITSHFMNKISIDQEAAKQNKRQSTSYFKNHEKRKKVIRRTKFTSKPENQDQNQQCGKCWF